MDFDFSDDQEQLRDAVRKWVGRSYGFERRRTAVRAGGYDTVAYRELAELGLARDESRGETEDHVAFVFEVMRYLIAGDDIAVCNLERQRRFFRSHVQTWVEAMCDAVNAHPRAQAYARVADFTRAFLGVEQQGFDMLA